MGNEHDLGSSDLLLQNNLFFPDFGLSMTHAGFINPTLKTYLFSLKYDFNEIKSVDWVHESINRLKVPVIDIPHGQLEADLFKLIGVAKRFLWLKISKANQTVLYPELEPYIAQLRTEETTHAHLNAVYYKNELDVQKCIKTF